MTTYERIPPNCVTGPKLTGNRESQWSFQEDHNKGWKFKLVIVWHEKSLCEMERPHWSTLIIPPKTTQDKKTGILSPHMEYKQSKVTRGIGDYIRSGQCIIGSRCSGYPVWTADMIGHVIKEYTHSPAFSHDDLVLVSDHGPRMLQINTTAFWVE